MTIVKTVMREISLHIMDLVENSIRAGASAVFIGIAADGEKDSLEILVEDNGHGFDVPAEKAFDPFFTKKSNGTGLGLSICKKIATAHNGNIELESVLGKGTKVRVFLPYLTQVEYQSEYESS